MSLNKAAVEKAEAGAGYGLSGTIGGLPKTMYYTPDGRRILAIPAIREYVIKDESGKVISQGTRDANLDHWLTAPPKKKKPYCPACDRWHNTLAQVEECKRKQQKFIDAMSRKSRDEQLESKDEELAKLKTQVEELSRQIQSLLVLK